MKIIIIILTGLMTLTPSTYSHLKNNKEFRVPTVGELEDMVTRNTFKESREFALSLGYSQFDTFSSYFVLPNETPSPLPESIETNTPQGIFLSKRNSLIISRDGAFALMSTDVKYFYNVLADIIGNGYAEKIERVPFENQIINGSILIPKIRFRKGELGDVYNLYVDFYQGYFRVFLMYIN